MLQAVPESTEPTRNTASEKSHIRLPPKRSVVQPVTGMAIAAASR